MQIRDVQFQGHAVSGTCSFRDKQFHHIFNHSAATHHMSDNLKAMVGQTFDVFMSRASH